MVRNFQYLTMNAGNHFCETIPIHRNDFDLSDCRTHAKFLSVMRNVYDRSVYHEICVAVDRDNNWVVLGITVEDGAQIAPGKYEFDVISRNLSNQQRINTLTRGFITVISNISLEAYGKAIKEHS